MKITLADMCGSIRGGEVFFESDSDRFFAGAGFLQAVSTLL